MPFDANSSAQSDWSIGANSRQKRVLPSRSRRGGPGLGHCEVDNLILETQKRKLENEPLIPADTPFLLTTNPKYAEDALNDSDSDIQINVVANDRYFDRPDVLKAFREQAVIQTPEYEAISESISGVGGRFRPRSQEEAVETSDTAYEKRHRRFENFEKRQRLREKEKLKHEHYKLKERIEQLRAMDGPNFMTLPSDAFTPAPQDIAEVVEEPMNSPYVSMDGGVSLVEGERRRKEMLEVAIMLEQRYSYLLPPRKVPEASSSTLKDTESREGDETDSERDSGIPASKKDKAPKLRTQSIKSSGSTTPVHSPASSRPLVSRKSLFNTPTFLPEPRRPRKNYRTSISTSAEPPDPTLIVEEKEDSSSSLMPGENGILPSQPLPPTPQLFRKEKSPSPIIVVDETDGLRSQSPPRTPIQSVRDEKSPSPHIIVVDDIPEDVILPSQPPPPPTPSQWVQNGKSPTPGIVVVEQVPENPRLPSQTPPPPTPFQSVPNDVSTPDIHSAEHPVESRDSLAIQNGTQAEDVSMEISDESQSVDTNIEVEVSQPDPEPLSNHMQHLESLAQEPEAAPPAAENIQPPVVKKRRGRPRINREELEARAEETKIEAVSISEPKQPQKKRKWGRRRRRRKALLSKATLAEQEQEASPEIRVQRGLFQRAGRSRVMEEESDVVSGIRLEELPAEVGLTDSISERPAKRHRRYSEVESISAAPSVDFDRGISATSLSIRGRTYVSYVDSRTGEKVRSPSLLMVACMRAAEKTNSRRARETISFGVPTPDFGKGTIVDYELPEDILYRNFRDRSLDSSGSSVTSDEQESSDQEEASSSDEEEQTEEEQTEEEQTEEEQTEEEQTEEEQTEEEQTDEEQTDEEQTDEEQTEEETGSVYRQSPELHQSNERNKHIESRRSTPDKPQEPVEPQSGINQNRRGIKLMEQGRFANRFLVYQGPYDEQLIASPEAEPMPEMPPGVRPRVPSRRRQHDSDDEELIWDSN